MLFFLKQDGIFQLYTQKLNPNVQHGYKLDLGDEMGYPLSFALSLEKECTALMCLCKLFDVKTLSKISVNALNFRMNYCPTVIIFLHKCHSINL